MVPADAANAVSHPPSATAGPTRWRSVGRRAEAIGAPWLPVPAQAGVRGALARLPAQGLRIVGADPNQLTIWADKGLSPLSWGEKVTVYVYQADEGQTAVVVDSALKFGLFSWGAHNRNFQRVYDAIEQGLGLAPAPGAPPQPYPQEQAPGPYPYQQQPAPPSTPEPPPGATRF